MWRSIMGVDHTHFLQIEENFFNLQKCLESPPWHTHTRKRLVKTPKLYFYDSGLVCWLVGLRAIEIKAGATVKPIAQ